VLADGASEAELDARSQPLKARAMVTAAAAVMAVDRGRRKLRVQVRMQVRLRCMAKVS
jgi:hypothetical protein